MARVVSAYAPASMGNVSVGYDLLGAAVSPVNGERLGDVVYIKASDQTSGEFTQTGAWAFKLPKDSSQNIVLKCVQHYCEKFALPSQNLSITLEKNLPVGSGLGSSASSVVAALVAINAWFNNRANQCQMLEMMGELEGQISGSVHYDNVAPSYLGGFQLMQQSAEQPCVAIPAFKHWYWVLAYSGCALTTKVMRELVPTQFEKSDTLAFGQHLASFVAASFTQNEAQALSSLVDVIAEPARAPNIPGFVAAKEGALAAGASQVGISGSGPTLFAVCLSKEKAEQVARYLTEHYLANDEGFVHICQLDNLGATVEVTE